MKFRHLLLLGACSSVFADCASTRPMDDSELAELQSYLSGNTLIQNPNESIFKIEPTKYSDGDSRADVYVGPVGTSPRVCALTRLVFTKAQNQNWQAAEQSFEYRAVIPETSNCKDGTTVQDYFEAPDMTASDLVRLVDDFPRILTTARELAALDPEYSNAAYALKEADVVLQSLAGPVTEESIEDGFVLEIGDGYSCSTSVFLVVIYVNDEPTVQIFAVATP